MSVRARLEAAERLKKGEDTQVAVAEEARKSEGVVPLVIPKAPEPAVEIDPSMPGIPTVAAPTASLAPVEPSAVAPVVSTPVVEPVPIVEERRYTWQPTDENDRPIGGLQVILYRTEEEKFQKMQEKTVLLLRQLRKERKEKAIGVPPEPVDDAEKFQNVVEFKPRELTADERFHIAQDLVSADKFADARDRLFESAFGAKPEVIASTLNDLQRREIQQRAVEHYVEFVNTSGFEDTLENRELVTSWLGTRNLAPTVANFRIAQKRLIEAGLLQEAPVVHQEPVPTPAPVATVATPAPVAPVAEAPKPQVPTTPSSALETQESQAKRHSHVPSGLNASMASPAGQLPVGGVSLTLAEIDQMSAEEYKKRSKDPAFLKLVNQLEEDAAKRRRVRAQE